ncbi:hypothetical protein C4573_03980 [Candidatus Woesearchaeota archaeon]|nr:MAG: hypothetical protein C4573_03980 [Candidatus Woesearchaeota archaeon]
MADLIISGIIEHNHRFLMAHSLLDGSWHFPQTRKHREESLEDAMNRCIHEKTRISLARIFPWIYFRRDSTTTLPHYAFFSGYAERCASVKDTQEQAYEWVIQSTVKDKLHVNTGYKGPILLEAFETYLRLFP